MQTSYNRDQAIAILGMLADTSFKHTESMICDEAIPVGRAVMRVPNTSDRVRLPKANYATLTASADLVASNSTIVTVDGVATTATVYATSHAATMAAIVAKIAALSTVANAWLDTTNNKVIHIVAVGPDIEAEAETTLGDTQATWTAAAASFRASDFFGLAQLSQRLEGGLPNVDNAAEYPIESLANILRRGRLYVNFETAFDPDKDTLYVRHTAATGKHIGDFRKDADTNKAVSLAGLPIRVVSHLSAAGMGVIEINLP